MDILGGGHHPAHAGPVRPGGEMGRQRPGRPRDAEIGEIPVVETRQHRHGQDQGFLHAGLARRPRHGLDGLLHHLPAAEGVKVEHGDPELDGPLGGLCHRVGDVVKLEVQKDPPPEALDAADDLGAEVREGLLADLVDPDMIAQALDPLQGLIDAVAHVEGKNEA